MRRIVTTSDSLGENIREHEGREQIHPGALYRSHYYRTGLHDRGHGHQHLDGNRHGGGGGGGGSVVEQRV